MDKQPQIIGKIHKGSGLGDSLFCYLSTRIRALDEQVSFGFVGKENFKGASFLNLNWGTDSTLPYHIEMPSGKLIIDADHDLYELTKIYYDPEFNFITKGIIDGCMAQDERYWMHHESEVREWLQVEPLEMSEDTCVINFRGGEFTVFPELFLTHEYWDSAIEIMRMVNPQMRFEIHTDDVATATTFFSNYNFPIIHDIALNWRSIRYAHYLIISNSSFAILPAWLNENTKLTIAPRYWARRNTKEWSLPQNYYNRFTYI